MIVSLRGRPLALTHTDPMHLTLFQRLPPAFFTLVGPLSLCIIVHYASLY